MPRKMDKVWPEKEKGNPKNQRMELWEPGSKQSCCERRMGGGLGM